MIKQVP